MELKIKDLKQIKNGLISFISTAYQIKVIDGKEQILKGLPSVLSHSITKKIKVIELEERIIQETEMNIFNKYSKLDEKTKQLSIPAESIQGFNNELLDYYESKILIEIDKINYADISKYSCDGNVLYLISSILEE